MKKNFSHPFKIKNLKFKILLLLLLSTQFFHCPAVNYNNPTDGGNGVGMQLMDTLMTTLAESNLTELKVVFTGNPSAITEGQTATVQMKMSRAITSPLTVTLTLDNPIMTIDGAATKEITFTPENATVEQSFTLAALPDENSISETVNLKITAAGLKETSYSISTIDSTIEIIQTVIFTGLPSTITEGQTANVQVKLVKAITSPITVVLTLDNSVITIDGFAFKILTFGPGNETTDQTITLAAVSDTNSISETVNLKVSATGLTDKTFSISTIDNTVEIEQEVVFTGMPATITEGQTANVQVRLTKAITSPITVVLTLDNSAITIDGSSLKILTFGEGSGTTDQTITLSAVSDTNSISETVNLKVSATGLTEKTFSISIIDNTVELVQAVVFTGLPSVITESQFVNVRVKLAKPVTSSLNVNLTLDNAAITIDSGSSKVLTFTPENATLDQTVTLTAVSDKNMSAETVTLKASASGLQDQTLTIATVDTTPPAPVITISNVPTSVTEGTTVSGIGVKLSGTVTAGYVLVISNSNSASIVANPSALIFTTSNYTIDQNVSLTALQDANLLNESVTFTVSAEGVEPVSFTVSSVEDDTQNISISGVTTLNEGQSGTISVSLTNQPTSNVVVNLSSSSTSALTLGTSSLTFTSANYNTPQSVAVNALSDTNTLSDNVTITATATGISSKTWNILCVEYPSGTISGLTSPLFLVNNGTDTITVSANGSFTFNTPNILYNVVAKTYLSSQTITINGTAYPAGQICIVSGKTGNNLLNTSNIIINCLGNYIIGESALALVKTGQAISYFTQDDGSSQKTLDKNYLDNGDGTVLDYVTGLTWQKCSMGTNNDPTCSGTATIADWTTAKSYCSSLSLASGGWRLPEGKEIASLFDLSKNSYSMIDTNVFPNTSSFQYWSTTESGSLTAPYPMAVIANFAIGFIGSISKTTPLFVRCVKGGVSIPTPIGQFTDNLNGTVKDNRTGLVWQKCSSGFNFNGVSCTGTAYEPFFWLTANENCNKSTVASRSWRLPNRNELQSLIEYTKSSAPRIHNLFPNTAPSPSEYWSSTTYSLDPTLAWAISFNDGTTTYPQPLKTLPKHYRCVSGP